MSERSPDWYRRHALRMRGLAKHLQNMRLGNTMTVLQRYELHILIDALHEEAANFVSAALLKEHKGEKK